MSKGGAAVRMVGLCLLAGVLLAGLLFPVAGGMGLASNQASDTVNSVSADLVEGDVPLTTTITDREGAPIAWLYDQNRFNVPYEHIADTMQAAIIAIEDRRFFEHDGVDWRGTSRALVSNLTSGGSALEGQGGSTLTMQYVKNYQLYVTAQTEEEQLAAIETTPARKLREIRVALQLERELSKQEILTRYLNVVFFGNNAYGIGAASRTYFDAAPTDLTIAQAALLAGMVRSPTQFDPVDHPEAATERRNLVISQMVDVGSITPEQGREARAEPLGIQQPLISLPNGCVNAGPAHGFYCQYVLDYLESLGITEEQLRTGGYVIRTNLDRRASNEAKAAANAQVPTNTPGIANVMAIVQPGRDRHTVSALVANRDYGLNADAGQTSYALPSSVAPFGAGSIYKTFTAATALERGLGIQSVVPSPNTYTSRLFRNGSDPYTVSNSSTGYPPSMTLQTALSTSPNTAFVALEDRIGSMDPIVDMAYRLGMRESLFGVNDAGRELAEDGSNGPPIGDLVKQQRRASFTLGPVPTNPLELANVAATLMSGGRWCPPTPVDTVTDRTGQRVQLGEAPCEQAVPEGLANTLAVGMGQDHISGTAANAAGSLGWSRPMLGKTGTTQDHQSAGFIGATPQYAAAVLTYADGNNPQPICDGTVPFLCGEGDIFGGRVPARTWYQTMNVLHQGLPVLPMPPTDPRYVTGGANNQIPNVIGLGENQARATLQGAGFQVSVAYDESQSPEGTVADQTPTGAGLPGDVVTIVVSTGPPPEPPPTREPRPPRGDGPGPDPDPDPGGGGNQPPAPPPPNDG